MKIGECCNREVVVAGRDTEILEAARLMRQHHVGDLVIVEDRGGTARPVGIVTDRDLVLEVLAGEVEPGSLTLGDVMGAALATVPEDEGIWETLEKMRELGVRRMPVVDAAGALAGLVTLDDLLELLTEAMEHMTRVIRSEIKTETRLRPS